MNEVDSTIEVTPKHFRDEFVFNENGESGLINDLRIFWILVKRHKWLFTFSILLITSFSLWYQYQYATYTSTAKFMVKDWSQSFQQIQPPYNNDRINQTLLTFLSDSVIREVAERNHLLDNFRGADHEKEKQDYLYGLLANISLHQADFNSFDLEVRTDNRYLSAAMANDIVRSAAEESNKIYQQDLSSRIEVIKKLLDQNSATSTGDEQMDLKFSALDEMIQKLAAKNVNQSDVLLIMMAFEDLKKIYDDRAVQLRLNEIMLDKISKNSVASIILIQRAVPDLSNYFISRLLFALGIALIVSALLPISIYGIVKLKEAN